VRKIGGKNMSEKTIEFGEIYKGDLDSDGHLSDYVGRNIVIKGVEFGELGTLGDYAILTVQIGNEIKRLHTFSEVIIRQCKKLEPHLKNGISVKAKLIKRKNYITLE
jgi:hypothetical protein